MNNDGDILKKNQHVLDILIKVYDIIDENYEIPGDIAFTYSSLKAKCERLFQQMLNENKNLSAMGKIPVQSLIIIHSDLIELLEELVSEDNISDFPTDIQKAYYNITGDVHVKEESFKTEKNYDIADKPLIPITALFGTEFANLTDTKNAKEEPKPKIRNTKKQNNSTKSTKKKIKKFPQPYCKICKRKFKYFRYYDEHIKRHSIVKPCMIKLVQIPSKILNEYKPFKCTECDFQSAYSYNLVSHQKTVHLALKKYRCLICNKNFSTNKYLRIHMRSHTNEKPYECRNCHQGFVDNSRLTKHMYLCLKGLVKKKDDYGKFTYNREDDNYKCKQCDKICTKMWTMYGHVRNKHEVKNKFKCDQCDYATSTDAFLRSHKRSHTQDDRPYKCDICGFAFKWKCDLSRHVKFKRCTKKKFKCPTCTLYLTNAEALQRHVTEVHIYEKKYKCKFCDYKAAVKWRLKMHTNRQHSDKETDTNDESTTSKNKDTLATLEEGVEI